MSRNGQIATLRASQPLIRILALAGCTISDLNIRLDDARRRVLRPGDHLLDGLAAAAGLPLASIRRRRNAILLEMKGVMPFWWYREHGHGDADLMFDGRLPLALWAGSVSRPLSDLIGGLEVLGDLKIERGSNWGNVGLVKLDAEWIAAGHVSSGRVDQTPRT